jgi:hypothetical protein
VHEKLGQSGRLWWQLDGIGLLNRSESRIWCMRSSASWARVCGWSWQAVGIGGLRPESPKQESNTSTTIIIDVEPPLYQPAAPTCTTDRPGADDHLHTVSESKQDACQTPLSNHQPPLPSRGTPDDTPVHYLAATHTLDARTGTGPRAPAALRGGLKFESGGKLTKRVPLWTILQEAQKNFACGALFVMPFR